MTRRSGSAKLTSQDLEDFSLVVTLDGILHGNAAAMLGSIVSRHLVNKGRNLGWLTNDAPPLTEFTDAGHEMLKAAQTYRGRAASAAAFSRPLPYTDTFTPMAEGRAKDLSGVLNSRRDGWAYRAVPATDSTGYWRIDVYDADGQYIGRWLESVPRTDGQYIGSL